MQRILKYEILLRELVKHTIQSLHSDDHSGLERALSAMRDVAEYINEVKRDNETLQIMNDIQSSITDWPLEESAFRSVRDCGTLLKDAEIKIKCHPDNKMKLRYVFIFDEIFLMFKSTRCAGSPGLASEERAARDRGHGVPHLRQGAHLADQSEEPHGAALGRVRAQVSHL